MLKRVVKWRNINLFAIIFTQCVFVNEIFCIVFIDEVFALRNTNKLLFQVLVCYPNRNLCVRFYCISRLLVFVLW